MTILYRQGDLREKRFYLFFGDDSRCPQYHSFRLFCYQRSRRSSVGILSVCCIFLCNTHERYFAKKQNLTGNLQNLFVLACGSLTCFLFLLRFSKSCTVCARACGASDNNKHGCRWLPFVDVTAREKKRNSLIHFETKMRPFGRIFQFFYL